MTAAYNDAAGRQPPQALPADVGGETLAPGVYKTGATPALGVTGTLTLDGQGDPNAVFVFQVGSALTTAVNSHVNLIGGAQPGNVFWQIGSSATLGTSSSFAGSILALTSVSINSGVTLNGRALARNGSVTLIDDTITVPSPPPPPPPPPPNPDPDPNPDPGPCPSGTAPAGIANPPITAFGTTSTPSPPSAGQPNDQSCFPNDNTHRPAAPRRRPRPVRHGRSPRSSQACHRRNLGPCRVDAWVASTEVSQGISSLDMGAARLRDGGASRVMERVRRVGGGD